MTVSQKQDSELRKEFLLCGLCHKANYWARAQILLQHMPTVEILRLSRFSQATANFKELVARCINVEAGFCELIQLIVRSNFAIIAKQWLKPKSKPAYPHAINGGGLQRVISLSVTGMRLPSTLPGP